MGANKKKSHLTFGYAFGVAIVLIYTLSFQSSLYSDIILRNADDKVLNTQQGRESLWPQLFSFVDVPSSSFDISSSAQTISNMELMLLALEEGVDMPTPTHTLFLKGLSLVHDYLAAGKYMLSVDETGMFILYDVHEKEIFYEKKIKQFHGTAEASNVVVSGDQKFFVYPIKKGSKVSLRMIDVEEVGTKELNRAFKKGVTTKGFDEIREVEFGPENKYITFKGRLKDQVDRYFVPVSKTKSGIVQLKQKKNQAIEGSEGQIFYDARGEFIVSADLNRKQWLHQIGYAPNFILHEPTFLGEQGDFSVAPVFNSENDLLLYAAKSAGGDELCLLSVKTKSGVAQPLKRKASGGYAIEDLVFSPSSRYVAFTQKTNEKEELYLIEIKESTGEQKDFHAMVDSFSAPVHISSAQSISDIFFSGDEKRILVKEGNSSRSAIAAYFFGEETQLKRVELPSAKQILNTTTAGPGDKYVIYAESSVSEGMPIDEMEIRLNLVMLENMKYSVVHGPWLDAENILIDGTNSNHNYLLYGVQSKRDDSGIAKTVLNIVFLESMSKHAIKRALEDPISFEVAEGYHLGVNSDDRSISVAAEDRVYIWAPERMPLTHDK